jgi:hypothetical protein
MQPSDEPKSANGIGIADEYEPDYQTKPNRSARGNHMNKADSNRLNAQSSTGPHDRSSTRLNAVKHGLLAKGITELDDSEAYESLAQRLAEAYRPVGDLEEFFVERIAFHIIRLQRAGRLEAEYINGEMHPLAKGPCLEDVFDPSVVEPATLSAPSAVNLVSGFQRYETAIESKLYRAINQLERLQRARQGEFVPAPESLDVSIHSGRERR